MRANDVEHEFRWKKASIVLAERRTVTLRERVSQSAFVFHPTLKATAASQNPFGFAGGAERREPLAYRRLRGFLPEGKHPIGVKRSVLQICLLFGCQNEGFGCGRTIYVNSFGLHGLANVSNRAIVGYVDAFFATIEPDPYEWNSDRVMLLRALVYRAEMVVWTELFECSDERSRLYCQTHKASFLLFSQPLFLFNTNLQCKLKRRAGTIIWYGPQLPAVILNNRAADRQPHPHSLRLGGVESIEDLFEILPVDPNTGVLYSDKHFVRFMLTRTDEQLSRSIGHRCHSFDTVHNEVENDLLQLHPIPQHRRKITGQVHP